MKHYQETNSSSPSQLFCREHIYTFLEETMGDEMSSQNVGVDGGWEAKKTAPGFELLDSQHLKKYCDQ